MIPNCKTGKRSSGGNFNNAGNAGPGALNLNNPASNANNNIVARPAMVANRRCNIKVLHSDFNLRGAYPKR